MQLYRLQILKKEMLKLIEGFEADNKHGTKGYRIFNLDSTQLTSCE